MCVCVYSNKLRTMYVNKLKKLMITKNKTE